MTYLDYILVGKCSYALYATKTNREEALPMTTGKQMFL